MTAPNTFAYTTSVHESAPTLAQVLLPFTGGWVEGTWVEVFAGALDTAIRLTGIGFSNVANGSIGEFDVGTGTPGNQLPLATAPSAAQSGYLRFGAPIRIAAGERVWMRYRQSNVAGFGSVPATLTYYEGPLSPDDALSTATGTLLTGTKTAGLAVSCGATAWTNPALWTTLSAATGTPWTVNAMMVYTDFFIGIPETFAEIDIGVGTVGHEIVLTTVRVRTWFGVIGTGTISLWPLLKGIAAGQRVALRVRSSTGGITYRVKVNYYPAALGDALCTTQATTFAPLSANSLTISTPASAWVSGAWVPFIASTDTPIAVTQMVMSFQTGAGEAEMDVGAAPAGSAPDSEIVVGTFRWSVSFTTMRVGQNPQALLLIARTIPAGYRVSLRARCPSVLGLTFTAALGYIPNPTFAQSSDEAVQETYIAGTNGAFSAASGVSFGWSLWAELTPETASDILMSGVAYHNLTGGGTVNTLIQIGVGPDGFEAAIATFNLGQWVAGNYGWIPVALLTLIASGSRVAVRWTANTTLPNNASRFGLTYYGVRAPEPPPEDCLALTDDPEPEPPTPSCLPLADLYTLVATLDGEALPVVSDGATIDVEVIG